MSLIWLSPKLRLRLVQTLYSWKFFLEDRLHQPVAANHGQTHQEQEALDASATFSERLGHLVPEVLADHSNYEVIVYGSSVSGCSDEFSDLDLLVVLSDACADIVHRRTTFQGQRLDITSGGFLTFCDHIAKGFPNNNNWLLNALIEGRSYGKIGNLVSQLQCRAARIYQAGPSALSDKQVERIHNELHSRMRSSLISCQRAREKAEYRFIAKLRCDQLAARFIYCRYILDERWTTSFEKSLEEMQ